MSGARRRCRCSGRLRSRNLLTVWHNVFEARRAQPGETLLIHCGSSCIGPWRSNSPRLWLQSDRHRRVEVQADAWF